MTEKEERPRRPRVPPTPFEQAVRYLKIRDHSEKELRQKLRQKGIAADDIDAALERVVRLGYVNEERFANARAESLISRGKLGPRGVAARLGAAGIDRARIQDAVKGAMGRHDEAETVKALVLKRFPEALGSSDRKLRGKAMRFLLGRGFSPAVIGRVLSEEIELPDPGGEP